MPINLYEVLFEAVYRRRNWNSWWDKFKNDYSLNQKEFAAMLFKRIGKPGGSRDVFILSPKRVLKVDSQGGGQNKQEWEASKKSGGLTPKVYEHSSDFKWIVVELVNPLSDPNEGPEEEYDKATNRFQGMWNQASGGITWNEFCGGSRHTKTMDQMERCSIKKLLTTQSQNQKQKIL